MVPAPIQTKQVGLSDYNNARKVWWAVDANGSLSPPPEHLQDAFFAGHEKSITPVSTLERPLIVVVGTGDLGLQLITAFGKHYDLIAYDESKERLAAVHEELAQMPNVVSTSDATCFTDATHFIVSLAPHVNEDGLFDVTSVRTVLSTIALYARPGSTIVVESSVNIGTTRSLLEILVVTKGMKAGFSPSLVDQYKGSSKKFTSNPKLISALEDIAPSSLSSITALYAPVFSTLIPVSHPEVAELNSLYDFDQSSIKAAYTSTKATTASVNFTDPFGTCIGSTSDPISYLSTLPLSPELVSAQDKSVDSLVLHEQADVTLSERPKACADRAMRLLLSGTRRRSSWTLQARRPRVLVVGVRSSTHPMQQYTQHQQLQTSPLLTTQTHASPGLAIIERLRARWDVTVEFSDPRVAMSEELISVGGSEVNRFDEGIRWHKMGLSWFDMVIVAEPLQELGLDDEALQRLARTIVVDFGCQ